MTEKRFDVGNLKIQDNAPKGRVYLLDMRGGVNALCSLINGLNDKSNRLEKENEQLKIRLNEEKEKALKFCRNIDTLTIEKEKLKQQRDFYYARLQKIIKIADGDLND